MRNRRPVRGGRGPFGIEAPQAEPPARAPPRRPQTATPPTYGVAVRNTPIATAPRFLNALAAIAPGRPDDADRSAKTLLRMRAFAHDDLDQRRGITPDLAGLPRDPLRRPIGRSYFH